MEKSLSFIINQLGEDRDQYFGAVSPPIVQSTNFCFKTVGDMRERLKNEFCAPFYTRGYNPTVAILRKKIAALEGAEDCMVFSSGSAAVASAVISVLKQGDHIICVRKPYSWTHTLFHQLLFRFGVETDFIDGTNIANFESAIRSNTRLIFLESPNSMTFELQDIPAVVELAKKHGILTMIDNSYATPINQQPIQMGVDVVCHSATKYFSGHSDVVAGAVCGKKEFIDQLFQKELMTLGAIISPHDAWQLIKGMRTLPVRLERVTQTAQKVVAFLESHPKIEKVYYPFSTSHPQYTLAKQQMKGCGGMFSIQIKTDNFSGVERFCDALHHFLLACSWGGYESLAFPVCAFSDSKETFTSALPWNLIRVYIGLEEADELINDLSNALEKV
jgi:cystathionine beta-lyase